MATVLEVLGKADSAIRPYGYQGKQQLNGTTTQVTYKVPTDVHTLGVTVYLASAGSFFLYGTRSTFAEIDAGTAIYTDVLGDGSTAQAATTSWSWDGSYNAIRVLRVTGSPLVEVTARRN